MIRTCRRCLVVTGLTLSGLASPPAAEAQAAGDTLTAEQYLGDFDALWGYVRDHYAYFHRKQTDWENVRDLYRPRAAQVTSTRQLVGLLEDVLSELYDPHAHLGVNTASSPRMIPTDTDLWAEWRNGRPVVTDVRAGSHAEEVGIRPGMEILAVDGEPAGDAVRERRPISLRSPDPAADDWALRAVLAGRHDRPVRLDISVGNQRRSFEFQPGRTTEPNALLAAAVLGDGIGYVRVHNSLGNTELIAAYDSALAELRHTRGLILDLRDTPSGGNSTVARGIMSRLVTAERPYQRHELPREEREFGVRRLWTEYVAPRGPFAYCAPVVVLVGRWTGSMGEGLAMGLDGMGRATVIGRPMAGLLGTLSESRLPNTGFVFRIPAERLFHVDGTPREEFVPRRTVLPGEPGADAALDAALRLLRQPTGPVEKPRMRGGGSMRPGVQRR